VGERELTILSLAVKEAASSGEGDRVRLASELEEMDVDEEVRFLEVEEKKLVIDVDFILYLELV
jgi:hypothetical protein